MIFRLYMLLSSPKQKEHMMQKADFINFRQYYKQASAQIPSDDFYQGFIAHKVAHSMQVLKFGRKIIGQTAELADKSQDFITAAERALLFHDVGRFKEGVLRSQAEQKNQKIGAASLQFNHCDLGYDTLSHHPFYSDPRILAAVKCHGMMLEDAYKLPEWRKFMQMPQKKEIKRILFLVRDADKLANLYSIKNEQRLSHDLFYKQLTEELREAPLSSENVRQFFANQVVCFKNVRSWADRILMVLSWINDINYPVSHNMCRRMRCFEYLLAELDKVNSDKNLQQKIVRRFVFK